MGGAFFAILFLKCNKYICMKNIAYIYSGIIFLTNKTDKFPYIICVRVCTHTLSFKDFFNDKKSFK